MLSLHERQTSFIKAVKIKFIRKSFGRLCVQAALCLNTADVHAINSVQYLQVVAKVAPVVDIT